MRISIQKIVFYIYMIINCLTPILGLQITHLIAFIAIPFKVYKFLKFFIYFAIVWLMYFALHIQYPTNITYYFTSSTMLFLTLFFAFISKESIADDRFNHKTLFNEFIVVNFVMTLIALGLFFSSFKDMMWSVYNVSSSLLEFPRLSMFTYEPSYYSLTIIPVFVYAFLTMFNHFSYKNLIYFTLIALPLTLSFSLGIILCFIISITIFYFIYLKRVLTRKRYRTLLIVSFVLICIILSIPNNPIIVRLFDVIDGGDTSANGRVYESYLLAWQIAKEHNIWTGIGIGQIKEIGAPIIREFYYLTDDAEAQIPCAMAEILCMYGILGVVLKLSVILFLFVKTRVIKNDYRFILFVLIFIYQFTGSYIHNILEYMLWVIVFWGKFDEFNVRKLSHESSLHSKT